MHQAGIRLSARGILRPPPLFGPSPHATIHPQPPDVPEKVGRSMVPLATTYARRRSEKRWRRSGQPPRQSPADARTMAAAGIEAVVLPAQRTQTVAHRAPPWCTTAPDCCHHAATPEQAYRQSLRNPSVPPLPDIYHGPRYVIP
jgi:hypothetical protein